MIVSQENKKKQVQNFFNEIDKFPMLCQSCGMCQAVCPVSAITISQNAFHQYVPHLDPDTCIGCQACIRSCCARESVYEAPSVIGKYRGIYIARSTDKNDIAAGSSGGVVTALLQFGLDTGYFQHVLTVSNQNSPIVAEPLYTENPRAESGSKYVSAPLCTKYDSAKTHSAATALPCQAKALRRQDPEIFLFGLFCSKLSNEGLIDYMLQKYKKKKASVQKISYRRGIWPGKFTVHFSDAAEPISENLNRSKFGAAYNSYCFSSSGCLLCDDYFAQTADLSFGDPWGRKQYADDYYGETIVIARSLRGLDLLQKAAGAGVIQMQEFSLEKLLRGHLKEIYNKKTALLQRLSVFKKESACMDGYDASFLIPADTFSFLNRYAIHNNWKRRKTPQKYKRLLHTPAYFLFFTRFAHAYFLNKRLKSGNNYAAYYKIAKNEHLETGEDHV